MIKVSAYEGENELITEKVFNTLTEATEWIHHIGISLHFRYVIEKF